MTWSLDTGLSGNDVFGSGSSSTGTAGTGENPSGASWVDRIFSTGTDYLSTYIDYAAQAELRRADSKFKIAEIQQEQLLTNVEVPNNVGATPDVVYIPDNDGSTTYGISKEMLMIGLVLVVAIAVSK